jgi:1-acyl-sn-glycerol-3-phosphate acyltransferase
MVTWNDAAPPQLPPLSAGQRLRGALRLVAALALTGASLALFLLGRFVRRRLIPGSGFHFAVARFWSRAMLRLIGVRRRVIGTPTPGGGVWLANHASWADILALRTARTVNFVSKAEVRGWPGVGWIAAVCDTVFIERKRSLSHEHRNVLADRLRAGELLCIFPEGTSSDGLRVLPFKSTLLGALFEPGAEAHAIVQPVTVNWIAPPGQPAEFFGWWGDMGFEDHIWDVLCRSLGGEVEVVFHPPAHVSDFADRKHLTRWAEAAVRGGKR